MEIVLNVIGWIFTNWVAIAQVISYIIAIATIIVKLTPTLADDNIVLPIIKFIGKYLALNKNVANEDRLVA